MNRKAHRRLHGCTPGGAVSLSEGEVDALTVECWLHASRFDLRTGHPLDPPATVPFPSTRCGSRTEAYTHK